MTQNLNGTFTGGSAFNSITINDPGQATDLNAAISVKNSITITAGTLTANTNTINLSGTSGTLITNSGVLNGAPSINVTSASGSPTFSSGVGGLIYTAFTLNGAGTLNLGESLTVQGALTITTGTFNAGGNFVTVGSVSSSNTNTRTIGLGTKTWTISGNGTVWDTSTVTGLTITGTSSTIEMTDTSSASSTFAGGGKTFGNIYWSRGPSSGSNFITGSNTFIDFKDDGSFAHSLLFTHTTTTTVTTFTVSGTPGNLITLNSDDNSNTHTLTAATGTISSDYLNIQHSVASGATGWYAGTHSINNQGVSVAGNGWIFTAPPANIVITSGVTTCAGSPNWTATTGNCNVNITDIQTQINAGTNVSFTANNSITVSNAFNKTSGGNMTMTMTAGDNIIFNAAVDTSSPVNKLSMYLNSNSAGLGSGYVNFAAAVSSNGGDITVGGGSGPISAGVGFAVGNTLQVVGIKIYNVAVSAGGGSIIANGQGFATTTNGNDGVHNFYYR